MKIARIRHVQNHLAESLGRSTGSRATRHRRWSDDAARAWLASLGASGRAPGVVGARTRSIWSVRAGTPKRSRLDAAFIQLRRGVLGAGASSPEAVASALAKLGYAADGARGRRARFLRGDLVLEATPVAISELTAVRFRLRDRATGKRKSGFLIGGAMLPKKEWHALAERYEEEIERFVRARKRQGRSSLPLDFDALKTFSLSGEHEKDRVREVEHEREIEVSLEALTAKLIELERSGLAPQGIVFYVDGPDGAGKTSTGAIVADALEKAGFIIRRERFKGPTEGEAAAVREGRETWLARFDRGLPARGEAVLWDRGPAGDPVYGSVDAASVQRMGEEFTGWERDLRARGVLMIKVELHASPEKQAATFGKRLARQMIADRIADIIRQGSDPVELAQLDEIAHKIDGDDFRGLARYGTVRRKYKRFIRATSGASRWLEIDATHRHEARLRLIEGTIRALTDYAEERRGRGL
jgi:polyphosphate kinase 2 (PPK2 family)